MLIKKADTPYARKIWAGVEKAASRCPEWMKSSVRIAAERQARLIIERERNEV